MKINKTQVLMVVGLIVMTLIIAYIGAQNKVIAEAKQEMMEQKKELIHARTYVSEIEAVKGAAENNKLEIIRNKEGLELSKEIVIENTRIWERSVWLGRCLDKKLVDLTISCEDEYLESHANYGGLN